MTLHDPGSQHLAPHWLTWTALRHFLPVPLLRQLIQLITSKISADKLMLGDLFEERYCPGLPGLESWALRALPVTSPVATYLQRRIQYFLWQNDSEAYPPEKDDLPLDRKGGPIDLEAATRLGAIDFDTDHSSLQGIRPQVEDSLSALANIIEVGSQTVRTVSVDVFVAQMAERLTGIEPLLASVIMKHIGDLCADVDEWEKACDIYKLAREGLSVIEEPVWQSYTNILQDILLQSIATATRVTAGPLASFDQLHSALDKATLDTKPLFSMNAPFDAINAQIRSASSLGGLIERRSTLVAPPLYHDAYDLDSVNQYFIERKYQDAQRACWGVLRRQIALGLASETRATKAVFSRAILAQLNSEKKTHGESRSFALGVRLLLESGDSNGAEKLTWPEKLVETYVDEQAVTHLRGIADRHHGSAAERKRVAVEVLRAWILGVPASRRVLAHTMLGYVAKCAGQESVGLFSNHDLGGRSLEILEEVAKLRPEFRRGNIDQVHSAILSKLQSNKFWRERSQAMELALQYMDVLSDEQCRTLIHSILRLLAATDPAKQMWPIVRPALQVLVSKRSALLSKQEPKLGNQVLGAVLRFGTEQSTESASLIFYLRDFDPSLLQDQSIITAVQPAVQAIRKDVSNINSSAAAAQVQALLLSPTISGVDGVYDALNSLQAILSTSDAKGPSISLAHSYGAILMLADRQEAFARELSIERSTIDEKWHEIFFSVLNLWAAVKANPLVLASFSFPPPTAPNSVIVHNWAFASVRFAESIGKKKPMMDALFSAAQQESLRDSISLALAIGSSANENLNITPDKIESESADVFYAALGQRLSVLDKLDLKIVCGVCKALLEQCFRHGPRGLDAAVLVYAAQLKLNGQFDRESGSDYLKRVEENRELRLSLIPLLINIDVRS